MERKINGNSEILLQLRKNTGWMDKHWTFAACGHVEPNENPKTSSL